MTPNGSSRQNDSDAGDVAVEEQHLTAVLLGGQETVGPVCALEKVAI